MMLRSYRKIMKRSLYCCLAILSVASVAAPSLAGASRRSRVTARTKRVVPKAPWKKAWNKYASNESGYASVYLYPVAGQISSKSWYTHINKRMAEANRRHAGTVKGWNKFFADHQHKGAFLNDIVTYPAYKQISDASYNANHEKHGQNWLIDVPYADTVGLGQGGTKGGGVEADYKRALMVANLPMHDMTPHQELVLRNWAEPVRNGYRLLTTFKDWMARYRNAPQINVNDNNRSTLYTYNNKRNMFTPTQGVNGYGTTYIYNPISGRYNRVSNKQAVKQLTQKNETIAQVINDYMNEISQADQNNPILSDTARKLVARFASQPGTTQAQAYREAIQFCSTEQGRRLVYSANRAQALQNKSKAASTQQGLTNISELLALQSTQAFARVPKNEDAAEARYLLHHPAILSYLAQKYHANIQGLAEPTDADASKAANDANAYASQFKSSQRKQIPEGIISSNPDVQRQMALVNDGIIMLAKQEGLKVPSNILGH